MKDADARVVLHVTVLADEVQMEGEWSDDYGDSFRILEDANNHNQTFVRSTFQQRTPDPVIAEWFKYPSKDYFGELLPE